MMADRVSTIRFKVEGTDQAARGMRQLLNQFRTFTETANKLFSQGQGGAIVGANPDAIKATYDKAVAIHIAGQNKLRQLEARQWDQTKKQYKEQEKSKAEHDDLVYAREAPKLEQAARANKAATKQQTDEMNARAARLKADILAREAEKEIENGVDREIDREEARVRRQKIVAEKRKNVTEDAGGGSGGGMRGFGGRMIIAHAVGMAASDLIGDEKGGKEIGSVVGAFMFGGPQVAAAVAGMEVVGSMFRAHRDAAKAADKAVADYAKTVRELGERWAEVGESQVSRGSFGDAMIKQARQASDAADTLVTQIREASEGSMGGRDIGEILADSPYGSVARFFGMSVDTGEDSATSKKVQGMQKQANALNAAANAARKFADQEAKDYTGDQIGINRAQIAQYQIAANTPRMLREQLDLTASIRVEEEKRFALHRQQFAAAKAAVDMTTPGSAAHASAVNAKEQLIEQQVLENAAAKAKNKAATDMLNFQQGEDLNRAQATAAEAHIAITTGMYERERAVRHAAYDEEIREAGLQGKQMQDLVRQSVADRIKLEEKQDIEQQTIKTQDAVIIASTRGYERQHELREAAYARELQEAKAKGEAVYNLKVQEINALRDAEKKDNKEHIRDTMAAFDPASAVGRLRDQMDDLKAAGATPAQIAAIKGEALTGNIDRQIQHQRVALAVQNGQMNREQAAIMNAVIDNPLARAAGEEGKKVRARIAEQASLDEQIRGGETIRSGRFATGAVGFLNLAAMNTDHVNDPVQLQKHANDIATKQLQVLEQLYANPAAS